MIQQVIFKCDFCGLTAGPFYTMARYMNPLGTKKSVTPNEMFDLEWADKPEDNLKGSHICHQCAAKLDHFIDPPNSKPCPPPPSEEAEEI